MLLTLDAAQYHVIPLSLFLSPSDTALTVDNVVRELKDVTWKKLCCVLLLPLSQQLKIENEYATENQRRNAAVHFWLFSDPYASWRKLIRQLDRLRQHALAERLHDYAEKLTGMLISCMNMACALCAQDVDPLSPCFYRPQPNT